MFIWNPRPLWEQSRYESWGIHVQVHGVGDKNRQTYITVGKISYPACYYLCLLCSQSSFHIALCNTNSDSASQCLTLKTRSQFECFCESVKAQFSNELTTLWSSLQYVVPPTYHRRALLLGHSTYLSCETAVFEAHSALCGVFFFPLIPLFSSNMVLHHLWLQ